MKKQIFAVALLVGILSVMCALGTGFSVWAAEDSEDHKSDACSGDAHSIGWKNDETNHWGACECGAVTKAKEAHEFEEKTVIEAGVGQNGKVLKQCKVCGYSIVVEVPGTPEINPAPPLTTEARTEKAPTTAAPTTATVATTTEAKYEVNSKPVEANKADGIVPSITTNKIGEATLTSIRQTNKTTVKVNKMVIKGVEYDIITIGKNAFKNALKAKTIELPATVKTIKEGAFSGCYRLRTIKINIKKSITVEEDAFKGLDTTRITIKVNKKMPAKQLKKFKKVLKKAGFKGKVKK